MSTPGPLDDPRARWLIGTLRLLYEELAPGDQPIAVSIVALSGSQLVTYGFDACNDEITRLVTDVSDIGVVADALRNGDLSGVVTDATVRDGPP